MPVYIDTKPYWYQTLQVLGTKRNLFGLLLLKCRTI